MNLAIRMRGVTLISRKAILNDKNHDICAALLQVHILRSDSHAHLHFSFSLTSTYILSYNRCLNLPLTVLYTYRHTQTHNFIITFSQSLSFYFTRTHKLSLTHDLFCDDWHRVNTNSLLLSLSLILSFSISHLFYSHSSSHISSHNLSLTHPHTHCNSLTVVMLISITHTQSLSFSLLLSFSIFH